MSEQKEVQLDQAEQEILADINMYRESIRSEKESSKQKTRVYYKEINKLKEALNHLKQIKELTNKKIEKKE